MFKNPLQHLTSAHVSSEPSPQLGLWKFTDCRGWFHLLCKWLNKTWNDPYSYSCLVNIPDLKCTWENSCFPIGASFAVCIGLANGKARSSAEPSAESIPRSTALLGPGLCIAATEGRMCPVQTVSTKKCVYKVWCIILNSPLSFLLVTALKHEFVSRTSFPIYINVRKGKLALKAICP